MIFDSTNKFSTKQAVTATAESTNVIDLGVSLRDVGVGEPVRIIAIVEDAFAGLTSMAVSIETSNVENFGSGVTTLVTSQAVPAASLVAGYAFPPIHLPKGIDGRYLRVNYTVVGTGTAGTVSTGVVMGHQLND